MGLPSRRNSTHLWTLLGVLPARARRSERLRSTHSGGSRLTGFLLGKKMIEMQVHAYPSKEARIGQGPDALAVHCRASFCR